ncbi:YtxH domain-containing protein [Cellulomonas dongxiuzhuiae]|uniref:YtxH domain-containing protein n=1 Tax=Cellulomonas dongxiuzhuiae TaxID=2819979 RepID=A0ABX8GIM5_9CELL|nr:YtxH domain-containing protein [Cellulomonas dongxiuzhuiae]MBO3087876.1 YtxH domain-containing protein [Cellulomonas dongxiuzhuiae]MBO3094775.1 YtxH domain-containing protein [Cellulomonas dongxiuzhuiae]QWC15768.1 YtxH domain-containing protein [Cellulomonas dongxiuzhuiae]
MKGKLAFVVGTGVGYLLGTRAGRQQFEKIKTWASDTWQDPRLQGYVHNAEQAATEFAKTQGGALKEKAVSTAKSKFGSSGSSDDDASSETSTWEPADGPLVDADDANPDAPRV